MQGLASGMNVDDAEVPAASAPLPPAPVAVQHTSLAGLAGTERIEI